MTWNRTRILAILLFASLAVNLVFAGALIGRWAWHGWSHGDDAGIGHHAGAWLKHFADHDDAPEIENLWQRHKAAIEAMHDEGVEARRAVRDALVAEPFDADAYAKALQTRREHMDRIRGQYHSLMVELSQLLTPEQREKLAKRAGRGRWHWRRHHD